MGKWDERGDVTTKQILQGSFFCVAMVFGCYTP